MGKLIQAAQKRKDDKPEVKGPDVDSVFKENAELKTEMDLLEQKIVSVSKENEELKNTVDQYKKCMSEENSKFKTEKEEQFNDQKLEVFSQETLQKKKDNDELRIKLIQAAQKRKDDKPEVKGPDVDSLFKENAELKREMDLLKQKKRH